MMRDFKKKSELWRQRWFRYIVSTKWTIFIKWLKFYVFSWWIFVEIIIIFKTENKN